MVDYWPATLFSYPDAIFLPSVRFAHWRERPRKQPRLGHAILEIILLALIFLGAGPFFENPTVVTVFMSADGLPRAVHRLRHHPDRPWIDIHQQSHCVTASFPRLCLEKLVLICHFFIVTKQVFRSRLPTNEKIFIHSGSV